MNGTLFIIGISMDFNDFLSARFVTITTAPPDLVPRAITLTKILTSKMAHTSDLIWEFHLMVECLTIGSFTK
jgi:hypothetical protein